jgi:hypothetical protein
MIVCPQNPPRDVCVLILRLASSYTGPTQSMTRSVLSGSSSNSVLPSPNRHTGSLGSVAVSGPSNAVSPQTSSPAGGFSLSSPLGSSNLETKPTDSSQPSISTSLILSLTSSRPPSTSETLSSWDIGPKLTSTRSLSTSETLSSWDIDPKSTSIQPPSISETLSSWDIGPKPTSSNPNTGVPLSVSAIPSGSTSTISSSGRTGSSEIGSNARGPGNGQGPPLPKVIQGPRPSSCSTGS